MPWGYDAETRQVFGFTGKKMTAEDYDREADVIFENWYRGYTGGDIQDVLAWAAISRKQAAKLRTASNQDTKPPSD